MKFKSLSKIAIAGAALAATAATLGTSTYAWYVSNDNVAMSGVTGATAGTEVGANLVIASNLVTSTGDAPYNWGPSITLAQAADRSAYTQENSYGKFVAEALNPQSAEDITASTIAWKDADGAAATATFIEFKVWIKNSKAAVITPEFGLANTTTGTLKTQTAYNPNGLPTKKAGANTAVQPNDSFTVDAVQALRMEIVKESETTYASTNKTTEIFKVAEMAKNTELNAGYTTDASKFATGGDANEYYKNMKGKTAYNTTGYSAADRTTGSGVSLANVYSGEKSEWGTFNVAADEAVKLSFRIWLEGADADCWDSCIAQTFAFNLKFTAADAPANSGN